MRPPSSVVFVAELGWASVPGNGKLFLSTAWHPTIHWVLGIKWLYLHSPTLLHDVLLQ